MLKDLCLVIISYPINTKDKCIEAYWKKFQKIKFLVYFDFYWSGRRDSNPRLQPWQGCRSTQKLCLFLKKQYHFSLRKWEPSTSTLARLRSTPELRPHWFFVVTWYIHESIIKKIWFMLQFIRTYRTIKKRKVQEYYKYITWPSFYCWRFKKIKRKNKWCA